MSMYDKDPWDLMVELADHSQIMAKQVALLLDNQEKLAKALNGLQAQVEILKEEYEYLATNRKR